MTISRVFLILMILLMIYLSVESKQWLGTTGWSLSLWAAIGWIIEDIKESKWRAGL